MNFFKSILSDDPEPQTTSDDDTVEDWTFGDLIKTFAAQSESVIETYRRDLTEFRSGLETETKIIREAASRAVKDLPASLEAGASAAHGALDGVIKSISKEASIFASDGELETPETNRSFRYSRFEAQLSAIQSDLNTFCEEPEDVEEYGKWKSGFDLEGKSDEIEGLLGGNRNLEGVYVRVVPSAVDDETFWCRYFYRVDKLKQQEMVRANLVKRAISIDEEEEELSWDFDDDEVESGNGSEKTNDLNLVEKQEGSRSGSRDEKEGGDFNVEENNVVELSEKNQENVSLGENEVKSEEVAEMKIDENVKSEEIVQEKSESGEKGGGEEKEDVGWDEIEDVESGDEKKISASTEGGSRNRDELRKRLSAEEDDEDLNWDIEDDDDEPGKA